MLLENILRSRQAPKRFKTEIRAAARAGTGVSGSTDCTVCGHVHARTRLLRGPLRNPGSIDFVNCCAMGNQTKYVQLLIRPYFRRQRRRTDGLNRTVKCASRSSDDRAVQQNKTGSHRMGARRMNLKTEMHVKSDPRRARRTSRRQKFSVKRQADLTRLDPIASVIRPSNRDALGNHPRQVPPPAKTNPAMLASQSRSHAGMTLVHAEILVGTTHMLKHSASASCAPPERSRHLLGETLLFIDSPPAVAFVFAVPPNLINGIKANNHLRSDPALLLARRPLASASRLRIHFASSHTCVRPSPCASAAFSFSFDRPRTSSDSSRAPADETRTRKMARTVRTPGENAPPELVFALPSTSATGAPAPIRARTSSGGGEASARTSAVRLHGLECGARNQS
ncbi:hypothetical protein C8R44DRAFT_752733 [Mycena epipterygia]|nr:hypothetical protein C8R44DRAFT_752733 [Mycena epipterygia]